MHRVYHEDLKNHIPIKPDFREGYSCLHHGCNEIFFDYHELRRHKQQQHPMVELKCRLCDRKGVNIKICSLQDISSLSEESISSPIQYVFNAELIHFPTS